MVKLAPSPPSAEGVARAWQLASSIVMVCPLTCAMFIELPFLVVRPLLNCNEPKLSSGKSLARELGSSSIHSADDSDE